MNLPQFTRTLELWPGDCQALGDVLARFVKYRLGLQAQGSALSQLDALRLKPAAKLGKKFTRLHYTDTAMSRRTNRRLKIDYDDLLVLNAILREHAIADTHPYPHRLVGHIDQVSLSLEPHFTR